MRIGETLFLRKLIRHYSSTGKLTDYESFSSIFVTILSTAYLIKNNKKTFQFISKNLITLYDSCLFILYVIRVRLFEANNFDVETKKYIDENLIAELTQSFGHFFKCTDINNKRISFSRFKVYDEAIFEEFQRTNNGDIKAAFEEFKIIIKSDIINNSFKEFTSNSPLYLLNSLDETIKCDFECKYIADIAIKEFEHEINNFYI